MSTKYSLGASRQSHRSIIAWWAARSRAPAASRRRRVETHPLQRRSVPGLHVRRPGRLAELPREALVVHPELRAGEMPVEGPAPALDQLRALRETRGRAGMDPDHVIEDSGVAGRLVDVLRVAGVVLAELALEHRESGDPRQPAEQPEGTALHRRVVGSPERPAPRASRPRGRRIRAPCRRPASPATGRAPARTRGCRCSSRRARPGRAAGGGTGRGPGTSVRRRDPARSRTRCG